MRRRCPKCKRKLQLKRFHWRRKCDGLRQSYCADCTSAWKKQHAAQYREVTNAQQARWHAKRKAWVDSHKEGKPCADCKHLFPVYVLDFDHREGEKKCFDIGHVSRHKSKEEILKEIAKCDVVCANCHRIRTYLRMVRKRSARLGPTAGQTETLPMIQTDGAIHYRSLCMEYGSESRQEQVLPQEPDLHLVLQVAPRRIC